MVSLLCGMVGLATCRSEVNEYLLPQSSKRPFTCQVHVRYSGRLMDSFHALAPSRLREAASTAPRRVPPRTRARGTSVSVAPTRERILSAAAQLFAEHGFASTSMPAIAALSGITAGAIYRHFKSKAELLLE